MRCVEILGLMRSCLLVNLLPSLLVSACATPTTDSAATGPQRLSDRLTDTTWACQWISLNAPLNDFPSVTSRVEVDHTMSFTATTMTDDLPERLYDWATTAPDTYAKELAYETGFNAPATAEVAYTMDEVTWTPISDDEIMFSLRDTLGRFGGNVATTVRWDSEGMWMEARPYGGVASSYSRCDRTSPPAGETGT